MSETKLHSVLPGKVQALDLGTGTTVHHLPDWNKYDDPKKMQVLRKIAEMRGRDPRIAKLAVSVIKKAKIKPRDYKGQAECLLKWVQNPKNVYYVNEPGERLQDPIFTIRNGFGDCDDMVILLCSLFESVKLPWKYVISGRSRIDGKKMRYIEGEQYPNDGDWTHIYCMVGTPPFQPTEWYFCETTVEGVPLGWDVISGDHSYLPEMVKTKKGPQRIMDIGIKAPRGFKPVPLPKNRQWSPAIAEALDRAGEEAHYSGMFNLVRNSGIGSSVGSSVATEMLDSESKGSTSRLFDFKKIGQAVSTGVLISVATQLVLDYVRSTDTWAKIARKK
jgi:hypothetical protein